MWARRRELTCAHTDTPDAWTATMSEDDVVDQSGFSDSHGADSRVAMVNVVHALKRVSVDGSEVARREPNHTLEHPPANRFERARAPLAPTESITHREQRFRENEPELALLRR